MQHKRLKLGMLGGGVGAFIGGIHRIAARIDDCYELVCGAFSSDAQKSKESGEALGINANRVYVNYTEMFASELALPEKERMQVVSIVTPNHLHFAPAKLALENGFNVILDKPMTFTLAEAYTLQEVLKNVTGKFCLTHTYTGYPMLKEAKQLIASGKIGTVRKVYGEYPQGWLSTFIDKEQKQAAWRTDPTKSGIAGAMGDIGTHIFNLIEYVSGLQVNKLCADVNVIVPNRQLDDDGAALLKFNNGASGVLMATQVGAGEENNVKIRVYGDKGSIEWKQEDNNSLLVKILNEPTQLYRAGSPYLSAAAQHNCRTPAGHPEGYLEAFANIYRNFALHIINGDNATSEMKDYPSMEEGIRGMLFIEKVIASGKSDIKWVDI